MRRCLRQVSKRDAVQSFEVGFAWNEREDNSSKFGTLVAMKKPRVLEPGEIRAK